jgi:hypothetical protein
MSTGKKVSSFSAQRLDEMWFQYFQTVYLKGLSLPNLLWCS